MSTDLYAEIVRIRPRDPAAAERLLAIRDGLVASYHQHFPAFESARLLQPEDGGTWVDLWFWRTKADAEHALAHPELTPLFAEWQRLVEPVTFEWAAVLADH